MALLTVAIDLHCYECGRDVHIDYEPLGAAPPPAARPVSARFECPHCEHENVIDLPGPIVATKKPPATSLAG